MAALSAACLLDDRASRAGEPKDLPDLLAAVGDSRLLRARLTGVPHLPCTPSPKAEEGEVLCSAPRAGARVTRLREFRHRILDQDNSESSERLHLEALFLLASAPSHRVGEVISLLERAADKAPKNAWIRSDLAVARSLKAHLSAEPQAVVGVFEAVDEALKLAPDLPQALFNQALWLADVGLHEDAARVWQRFLAVEPDAAWRREGAHYLESLADADLALQWSALEAELRSTSPQADEIAGRLDRFHQPIRQLGEEKLLADWARTGDGRSLELALGLGRLLQRHGGDALLLDAATLAREQGVASALAAAHVAYAEGLEAYGRGDSTLARERFSSARAGFEHAGSPLAFWAELYLEIFAYFELDFAGVSARLGELASSPSLAAYPSLRARCHWIQGLSRSKQGDLVAGVRHYEVALALYRKLGELENEAAIRSLLAEVLQDLGDEQHAWDHRLAALRALPSVISPRRRHNILYEAADTLLHLGQPALALRFQNAMVRLTGRIEDPFFAVEAYLWRARTLDELGLAERARADLGQVRQAARNLEDPVRQRILADAALAAGVMGLDEDTAAALRDLDQALELYRASDERVRLPELYLARAEGHESLGDTPAAMADLEQGIRIFEESREHIPAQNLQVSYFDRSRELFDRMIRARLERGEPEEAWSYLERARARVLRDLVSGKGARSPGLAEVQALLTPGEALLEYAVLDDGSVLWVIRRDAFVPIRLPLSAAQVDRLTVDLPRLMDPVFGAERDLVLGRLSELYRRLVTPADPALEGIDRLVIVPDKALYRVPFAALRADGRFLVEQRTVAVSPSAALWAWAAGGNAPSPGPPASVLALGVAESPAAARLGVLPAAPREAEAVAALYPRHTLLINEAATEERLFDQLAGHEVLHLAAHAVINTRYPFLSYLALAAADNEDDGALYAHELYSRDLGGLRLVVLAACRSASGAISATEGPASLARPFLANGVREVIATLWDIDDRASAEVLESFHRHVRAGRSAAAALRLAQLECLRKNGPASVYNWGAFIDLGAG